jgi:histone H3
MARTKAEPVKNASTAEIPAVAGEKKARKPHRFRPGTVALREIRRYQKSTDLLIKKAPIRRLVREIDQDIHANNCHRFNGEAMSAIHTAAEAYLEELFASAIAISINRKATTLQRKDMRLAVKLTGM